MLIRATLRIGDKIWYKKYGGEHGKDVLRQRNEEACFQESRRGPFYTGLSFSLYPLLTPFPFGGIAWSGYAVVHGSRVPGIFFTSPSYTPRSFAAGYPERPSENVPPMLVLADLASTLILLLVLELFDKERRAATLATGSGGEKNTSVTSASGLSFQ